MQDMYEDLNVLISTWALSTMMDEEDQFVLILATLLWSA